MDSYNVNKMGVPTILEDYYIELTRKKTLKSVPKCPICKGAMKFEKYETIFTEGGSGYIRRFRCHRCEDFDVILWRK
ncbi:MAG: hypothetical protein GF329_04635 [Candidatus Lokiarchaeota archaeon]|nr:hypothetical protein [Candidatus Lokiarchaeota archaeon]